MSLQDHRKFPLGNFREFLGISPPWNFRREFAGLFGNSKFYLLLEFDGPV